jgi:methylthioribose-1-phosphate isomerase
VASHLSRALQSSPPPQYLSSPDTLEVHVGQILDYLFTARPTAVNLGAATRRLKQAMSASIGQDNNVRTIAQDLIAEGKKVADEDVGRNKMMSKLGGEWLIERVKRGGGTGKELNVLTVCNTGSLATSVCIS